MRPHEKGYKKTLDKPKKNYVAHPVEQTIVDTSVEHVKELEDELLKVKNRKCLFKRTEETAFRGRSKNKRTSSTVSEDSSN